MVEVCRLEKAAPDATSTAEQAEVDRLAGRLAQHLSERTAAITAAHVHNAQSGAIQLLVGEVLQHELGFDQEIVLTPGDGLVTRARPDFVYRLSEGRGIIAEVERGGTTTNNHDLKDVWKAHISPDTHHLFLIVPINNWRADGSPREKPFMAVCRRVGAFFGDPRREIDVASVHVFGY